MTTTERRRLARHPLVIEPTRWQTSLKIKVAFALAPYQRDPFGWRQVRLVALASPPLSHHVGTVVLSRPPSSHRHKVAVPHSLCLTLGLPQTALWCGPTLVSVSRPQTYKCSPPPTHLSHSGHAPTAHLSPFPTLVRRRKAVVVWIKSPALTPTQTAMRGDRCLLHWR